MSIHFLLATSNARTYECVYLWPRNHACVHVWEIQNIFINLPFYNKALPTKIILVSAAAPFFWRGKNCRWYAFFFAFHWMDSWDSVCVRMTSTTLVLECRHLTGDALRRESPCWKTAWTLARLWTSFKLVCCLPVLGTHCYQFPPVCRSRNVHVCPERFLKVFSSL